MEYSYARSIRETYNDTGLNKRVNERPNESRKDSGNEYLDLGFAWLEDYDKDGNYNTSGNYTKTIGDTENENPYIRTTQGLTREEQRQQPPSRESENALRLTRKRALRQGHRKFENNDIRETTTSGPTQRNEGSTKKNSSESRKKIQANYANRGMTRSMKSVHPRKFQIDKSLEENPYGWKALGATRHPTSKPQNLPMDKTFEENPYGWKALGATRHPISKSQNLSIDESVEENPYGWKALGATRHPISKSQNLSIDESVEENPYGWKALGATRHPISKSQNLSIDESDEENPYGWKALGATHHTKSRTQKLPIDETVEENPYGWKALGATRHPTSKLQNLPIDESVQDNPYGRNALVAKRNISYSDPDYDRTNATSRKRKIGQISISKNRLRSSEREDVIRHYRNSRRKYARAKRKQDQHEQTTSNNGGDVSQPVEANVVIQNTLGNRQPLRNTSGDGNLRGTTYDYAYTRNIVRTSLPKPIPKEAVIMPERGKIIWAKTNSPKLRIKQWTDLATDNAMRIWYEKFAQIKKRWAADYKDPSLLSGLSRKTDLGQKTLTSRSLDKKRQLSGRRKHAAIFGVVFLALLVTVVVPVTIVTSSNKSQDSCGEIPDIVNGTASANDTNFGGLLTIECDPGFEISENNTFLCSSTSSWASLPSCNKIQCNDYATPEHAILEPSTKQNFTFLDELVIICEEGYKIAGVNKTDCNENSTECSLSHEKSRNETVTCLPNGQWSSNVTCEIVDCKEFITPDHVLVVNNTNATVFGTLLELTCENGYVLNNENDSFVSCNSDGIWTGNPQCDIIPDIMFTISKETELIGNTVELRCILIGHLSNMAVEITRTVHNGSEEHVCNVSNNGTVDCEVQGITGNGSINNDAVNVTIVIVDVDCNDEGEYVCESVSRNSLNATVSLSVTKPVTTKPKLEMPMRMVLNFSETLHTISCQSDIGYPAGDLRIEYSMDNSSSFQTLMLGKEMVTNGTDGCLLNQTLSVSNYTFTESWNNTRIRCALYNNTEDTEPYKVSDDGIVELIENDCTLNGDGDRYHPFNCHYYIQCDQGDIDVRDCGASCPVIENSIVTNCTSNCTTLGC